MKFIFSLFLLSAILISGCTTKKKLVYMQSSEDATYTFPFLSYKIQKGDDLSIEVKSLDQNNSSLFNLRNDRVNDPYNSQSVYLNSYRVNEQGYVKIPVLGTFKVSGLIIDSVSALIERSVGEHLKNASVYVRLTSFKVTVLGEVKRPGTYDISDNKMNIFKALGLAGDLTDYANRRKVKVIRNTEAGSQTYTFDLTTNEVFNSPCYFLYPNDIVYIEPRRLKPLELNIDPLKGFISIGAIIVALRLLGIL